MKVFISSVISGIEDLRDAVARAVRALSHQVLRAEDFGARSDSPQTACLAGVREAEAVILILGSRYGAIQSSGLSATHEEYREARERCPVLVMVQEGVDRDQAQAQFLGEVQDWSRGHYTQTFASADQLLDAVVGALHNLELVSATGPIDQDEMLQRAVGLLPDERSSRSSDACLALVLTGGPLQTVLRPAQLDDQQLRDRLQQLALFGDAAVLTPQQGTDPAIDDDMLVFAQPDRSVAVSETGTIRLVAKIPAPDSGLSVIIEENVRDIIERFLRYANAVLAHIDSVNRLSHVVVVAKIFGAEHLGWRSRAAHERNPNSVRIHTFGGTEREAVHLSPPHRTRSALRQSASEIVDDLTVKLRRQGQNPRNSSW